MLVLLCSAEFATPLKLSCPFQTEHKGAITNHAQQRKFLISARPHARPFVLGGVCNSAETFMP